jgi:F1F0 ATPase subunit 2
MNLSTKMNSTLGLLFSLFAGVLLGAAFFGGLWWTVQRGLTSHQPALWFLGSMLVRTAIAVSGFYFVMQGDWRRLVACLAGFLLARIYVLRLTRKGHAKSVHLIREGAA